MNHQQLMRWEMLERNNEDGWPYDDMDGPMDIVDQIVPIPHIQGEWSGSALPLDIDILGETDFFEKKA